MGKIMLLSRLVATLPAAAWVGLGLLLPSRGLTTLDTRACTRIRVQETAHHYGAANRFIFDDKELPLRNTVNYGRSTVLTGFMAKMGQSWNEIPVSIQDELGCSPTLSVLFQGRVSRPFASPTSAATRRGSTQNFFFDPLNLATDENFAIYREAELKHGRVAMVSVVTCIGQTLSNDVIKVYQEGKIQNIFNSLLSPPFSKDVVTNLADTSSSTTKTGEVVVLQIPVNLQEAFLPSPLELLQNWTIWDWTRMVIVCGFVETFVWVQTDPQDMPGDYQVGYWGVRDKAMHERSLVCELENGRLAMLVMLYYIFMDIWGKFGFEILQRLSTTSAVDQ